MTTHTLKTWKQYFSRVQSGQKSFEVRLNDRDYQVGDLLILQESDQNSNAITGREVVVSVKYILNGGDFGIEEGYVVMGIEKQTLTNQ